jgi:hypothetical protein
MRIDDLRADSHAPATSATVGRITARAPSRIAISDAIVRSSAFPGLRFISASVSRTFRSLNTFT